MKTKIIGLTGGIGSGKTTIANYFASLGVPVYIADSEAKKLMNMPLIKNKIKAVFGNEIVDGEDVLIREKIAEIVFKDKEKLAQLNTIIHPAVKAHFEAWVSNHKNNAFVIKEAAILFESGSYKDCDAVILVSVPEEIRIERVMKRDHISREKVIDRIKNQWDDNAKKVLSQYIIHNIDIEKSKKRVKMIYKELNLQ